MLLLDKVFIDRRANSLRSREGGKPKFTGFFLAVEQKASIASDLAEVRERRISFVISSMFILVFFFFSFQNSILFDSISFEMYNRIFHLPNMVH